MGEDFLFLHFSISSTNAAPIFIMHAEKMCETYELIILKHFYKVIEKTRLLNSL